VGDTPSPISYSLTVSPIYIHTSIWHGSDVRLRPQPRSSSPFDRPPLRRNASGSKSFEIRAQRNRPRPANIGKAWIPSSAESADAISSPQRPRYEKYGWTIIQEDNAPGHKGHSNRYRELNGIEILEWPAQSPDLNPIESVWRGVGRDLGAGIRSWRYHITEEMLDRLVDSMPARLQAVIDAGGNPTPY